MGRVKVEFEFDLNEEKEDYEILTKCHKMYFAIHEVDSALRSALKYDDEIGECEKACNIMENCREMLRESEILDL